MRRFRFLPLGALPVAALTLSWFSSGPVRAAAAAITTLAAVGRDTTGGAVHPVSIAVVVTTDKKVYAPADEIAITLTLKNTSKQPVSLHFASGQKYDLELRKGRSEKSPVIWQWSRGRMFAEMLSSVLVAPGKSLTFNERYKPSSKPGDGTMPRLASGHYLITGIISTMGTDARPCGTISLVIK